MKSPMAAAFAHDAILRGVDDYGHFGAERLKHYYADRILDDSPATREFMSRRDVLVRNFLFAYRCIS